MMNWTKLPILAGLAVGVASFPAPFAFAQSTPSQPAAPPAATPAAQSISDDWRENYAYIVGMQAVIYGFPAVKSLNMRYGMVEKPVGYTDTPQSQWFRLRRTMCRPAS